MAPGWSVHDGAAALVHDGRVIAAIEEERLNRVKHSNFFPRNAIRQCLAEGGIRAEEIDCVAMNLAEQTHDIFPSDVGRPAADLFLEETERSTSTVRGMIGELFLEEFAVDVSQRLYFCEHHVAHLWSAWGPANYPTSLVVSFDGSGDGLSGLVGIGDESGLTILRRYGLQQSLGNIYADTIRLLGFKRFDEYKAMGLAPYGEPERFRPLFSKLFTLLPNGDYRVAERTERWAHIHRAGLVDQARRRGAEFDQIHSDIAAALQDALETIVMHVLSHFRATSKQANLCLAGGVAHNCTLNGRILYSGLFDSVFVQPAAHDAGGALGAALAATHDFAPAKARADRCQVFVGRGLGTQRQVAAELDAWRDQVSYQPVADVAREAAGRLAEGHVVGWVQGRSEFGPRALGHRSILADPRPASNKDRINRMVKKRESFRPFAPAVRHERMGDIVELPAADADFSYMTFTVPVRDEARDTLAAVTHVDGSARVQSVDRRDDPLFWTLIHEFDRLTGVPAVLNTSFNNNLEPIVDSVSDAVVCFLTTGIDVLLVGDFLVQRAPVSDWFAALSDLTIELPESRKLVARTHCRGNGRVSPYAVESTASRFFVETRVPVSESLFRLLLRADGHRTLAELSQEDGRPAEAERVLAHELLALWETRAVRLRPKARGQALGPSASNGQS
jgi:carbamoyltransferase